MDVDAAAFEPAAQVVAEHLHVARKHKQLGLGERQLLEQRRFLRRLVALHRKVVVGQSVPRHQAAHVVVIGEHAHHVHRQFAAVPAMQQVVEAMAVLGDRQHHLQPAPGVVQPGLHVEALEHRR